MQTIALFALNLELGTNSSLFILHSSFFTLHFPSLSFPPCYPACRFDVFAVEPHHDVAAAAGASHGRVVFTLAVYRDGRLLPVSEPFELNKLTGDIHYYHAGDTLEEVKLLNKYHQIYESFPQRMLCDTLLGRRTPLLRFASASS